MKSLSYVGGKEGSKVINEELGEVLIDKRGKKDDIAHGIGRKKPLHLRRYLMLFKGERL